MAKGNSILLTPDRAFRVRGIIETAETPKPGTCVQMDYTQSLVGNRCIFEVYNRDADGNRPLGPHIILDMGTAIGMLATGTYAAGDYCDAFIPLAGCEANFLFGNAAGTADDVTAGATLMIVNDGDGKFIPTTGSPECEPVLALETITDPTADQLFHGIWTGY